MIHPTPAAARRARERHERLVSVVPVESARERLRRCIEAREKAYWLYKSALTAMVDVERWVKLENDWREAIRASEEAMSELELQGGAQPGA